MVNAFTIKELKEVLLEPGNISAKNSCFTVSSDSSDENLTILLPGKIGNEFNKTLGFVNTYPGSLIFACLYGRGVVLIQKNDFEGEAKEIRVMGLRGGVQVEIPSGYAYTLINTGRTFLAVVDNLPKNKKYLDSTNILKKHGLVYYVIDKKGDISFEKNPNYAFHPQITNY